MVSCGVVNVIKVQYTSIQFLLGLFSLWCRFTGSMVHRFIGSQTKSYRRNRIDGSDYNNQNKIV